MLPLPGPRKPALFHAANRSPAPGGSLCRMSFPATLMLGLLLPVVPARAQVPIPVGDQAAPPATPSQSNLPADAPLNPALPTLFIVGDSTARNSADLGWGDHFAPSFDTNRINVANRARAGRSARSYIDEGLWAKTLAEMKPGDFLLLQMGHNDGGDLGGPKPRGDLKGVGDETQAVPQTTGPFAGRTETIHTFGWYLREMIDEAKAKGVHIILLTDTIRNIWTPGPDGKPHVEPDMGYDGWIREVAEQEHVPVAELGRVEAGVLEDLGPQKTAALFSLDHTHTSAAGAELVARAVVTAIQESGNSLNQYLRLEL